MFSCQPLLPFRLSTVNVITSIVCHEACSRGSHPIPKQGCSLRLPSSLFSLFFPTRRFSVSPLQIVKASLQIGYPKPAWRCPRRRRGVSLIPRLHSFGFHLLRRLRCGLLSHHIQKTAPITAFPPSTHAYLLTKRKHPSSNRSFVKSLVWIVYKIGLEMLRGG